MGDIPEEEPVFTAQFKLGAEYDASLKEPEKSFFQEVRDSLESLMGLIDASLKPLPKQTGDGSYLEEQPHDPLLKDLSTLRFRDVLTLAELVKGKVVPEPIDDKDYLMERIIQRASGFDPQSKIGQKMTAGFVNMLWHDLRHPPLSYLGDEFKYRMADGSNNNIRWPQLGAAGTPYARTVRPSTVQPHSMPDPGVLFDTLMSRKKFVEHPNKISSVLFYLATIIIHDIFRTDHKNSSISLTSSYLDLAPLYGSNQDEQNAVRLRKDGKLKPDCFSEKRILGFPPGVGCLLVMFNRFHNYVAENLAKINEGGRFRKPRDDDVQSMIDYDHHLFQTARLITCGLYINIILQDYVRVILNLNRTDRTWNLDPRATEGKQLFGDEADAGVGNQVSAEFNLVYRWHSTVSEKDAEWTDTRFKELFNGRSAKDISIPELVTGLDKWEKSIPVDPEKRTFGGLERQEKTGLFDDDALAKIWQESVEDVAGSFGANKVPECLRPVEILGIMQARSWNLATLNEFRAYFNLQKHETFESINKDPDVVSALKHLYDTPDKVELYPGLVVEQAKHPEVPGSGLCPSYTVSRAVLSDAVALVRGDRFYTVDYTPKNLTNWGFREASFDKEVDQGHVFYKLVLRALPRHFRQDSVYAHFPMVHPGENEKILDDLKIKHKYSYSPPSYVPHPRLITSYDACKSILDDKANYKVTWGEAITYLMQHDSRRYGADFMLSGDKAVNAQSRAMMRPALMKGGWYDEIKNFYEDITIELLNRHTYKLGDVNAVDIIRDIGNLAQAHFSAEVFSLPIKTEKTPLAIYSEMELYLVMALVFTCIFFDADTAKSFPLRQAARKHTQQLGKILEDLIVPLSRHGLVANFIERLHQTSPLPSYGSHMIQKLLESGLSSSDVVWTHILPTSGGMVANQGQLFAQVIDFYLMDENKHHLQEISRLAKLDDPASDELILRYFMEASRITSSVGLYRDVQQDTTVSDGDSTVHLKAGERIMCDLVTASHDERQFPNPETVDLTRDMASYIHYGWGPHKCLGFDVSKIALSTMLKTVAKLGNLRRAPGPTGQLKTFRVDGGYSLYLTPDGASYFPFPTTMKVWFDGEIPERKVVE